MEVITILLGAFGLFLVGAIFVVFGGLGESTPAFLGGWSAIFASGFYPAYMLLHAYSGNIIVDIVAGVIGGTSVFVITYWSLFKR